MALVAERLIYRNISITNTKLSGRLAQAEGLINLGIRFQCHHCGHVLHVKNFQAGKRGRCPNCNGSFRIPLASAARSLDVQTKFVGAESVGEETADDNLGEQVLELENAQEPMVTNDEVSKSASETVAVAATNAIEAMDPNAPAVIAQAPNAIWYLRTASGEQFGPTPAATMLRWLREGRIGSDHYVWRDDWPAWKSANDVFGHYLQRSSDNERSNSQDLLVKTTAEIPPLSPQATKKPLAPNSPSTLDQATQAIPTSHQRRNQKRYGWLIMILLSVFIILLTVLAYVLYSQMNPGPKISGGKRITVVGFAKIPCQNFS